MAINRTYQAWLMDRFREQRMFGFQHPTSSRKAPRYRFNGEQGKRERERRLKQIKYYNLKSEKVNNNE